MGVAFASLWLAFAAVPCAAMEELGIDLGHQHAGATVAAAEPAHDCPHCPPAQPASATPGDCIGLDDALASKLATLDLVLAAPPAEPTLAPVVDPGHRLAVAARDRDRPPAVPLNLRYCTFLE